MLCYYSTVEFLALSFDIMVSRNYKETRKWQCVKICVHIYQGELAEFEFVQELINMNLTNLAAILLTCISAMISSCKLDLYLDLDYINVREAYMIS